MKYVSFSLWGDNPLYNIGAIRNSEQISKFYPNWQMILYYDNSVPKKTIETLEKNNVTLINSNGLPYGCFWRFFASDIDDCEYAVFRDCDSRLSEREFLSVDEWIKSGKSLHVMRDHPAHGVPYGAQGLGILAGMWGIKGNIIKMKEEVQKFTTNKKNYYGIDQTFLQEIYSKYINDRFTHDEFYEKKPFPIPRKNGRFVGERIDINENPLTEDYKILL